MDVAPEMRGGVVGEKVEGRAGDDGAGAHECDDGDEPVAKEEPHRLGIGCALRNVEGRTA
jgi:hypothetical protein